MTSSKNQLTKYLILLLIFSACIANLCHAQQLNDTLKDSAIVLKVYNPDQKPSDLGPDSLGSAAIGNIIIIQVDHLRSLLNRAKEQKIRLFINGRMITNVEPRYGAPEQDKGIVQYTLDRNNKNDIIWADILGSPKLNGDFFEKPVKISVGLENDYAIPAKDQGIDNVNFKLTRIHLGWFLACLAGLFFYFYLMYSYIKKGLLRDRGVDVSVVGLKNLDQSSVPYSLGRFQMAFWFTLVIISLLFIWLVTDAYDIVTTSVLALMGISAGTALSAAVIDNNKSEQLIQQLIPQQSEKKKLESDIADLEKQTTANPPPNNLADLQIQLSTKRARLNEITPEIAKNEKALTPPESRGFFNDILTDVNGITFHRLQMFIWTLILGLFFIYSVWKRLSMPEFSTTLLVLQGLTSGTYLGFKFPEKQT